MEDPLYWVREVTFDEDHSQARTGHGPHVMASLRNLAITVLRLTGVTNVAAALRHQARRLDRPLHTLTTCRRDFADALGTTRSWVLRLTVWVGSHVTSVRIPSSTA